MSDPKVNLFQLKNILMGQADKNGSKRIEDGEERSIFDQALKAEVENNKISQEQANAIYDFLGLEIKGAGPRKVSPSSSNDNGNSTTNVNDNTDGGVVINVTNNNNWYVNITVHSDTKEQIEKLIAALTENNNANFAALITFLDEKLKDNSDYMLEFIKGLFNEFKNSQEVDLGQIQDLLKVVLEELQKQTDKVGDLQVNIDNMNKAILDLLNKQFDVLKMMGLDMSELVKLVKDSNAKQDVQVELLTNIYDAITKLTGNFSNVGDENILKKLDEIVALFKAGNASLEEVVALLNAIKADTSENNEIGKQILNKQDAILAAIKEIGVDVKKIDANTKNLLVQVLAQADDMKDIKELLVAMKKDIEEGNNIAKEILAAIKQLGSDVAVDLKKIYNKIGTGGGEGGGLTAEQFEALLAAIKENTAEVKNNTEISKQILKAIGNLGGDITTQLTNIYKKIGTGGGEGGGLTAEQFEELLAAINKNTDAVNNNTNVSVNNKNEIIAAIKENFVEMLEKGDEINANMSAGFNAILEAIQNGDEDSKALLEKLLAAIKENTQVSKENAQAIIDAIGKLGIKLGDKIDGLDITVSEGITNILAKIGNGGGGGQAIDYSKVLADILAAIKKLDGDVNTIGDSVNKNFGTLIAILGDTNNKIDINAQLLLQKMDDILKAIQDHDVNVTVDVTGKVECKCNCCNGNGGNPDEGVHVKGKRFAPPSPQQHEAIHAKIEEYQKVFNAVFNGGEATGIQDFPEAGDAKKDGKYLENGKIVIIKNGIKYDASGKRI